VTSVTQGAPRRRLSAPERRALILDAALERFAAAGYNETSLEEVAARAGISKALIYEHFGSKRALFRALQGTYVEELMERVSGAIAAAEPGEERLREGLSAFLGYVEERRDAWRMLVRNVADPEIGASLERLRQEVAGAITVLMTEEAPPGILPGIPREQALAMTAEQIVGAAQSLANWWDEHRDVPRTHVLELAMDLLWVGMERLAAGERWAR
jgi:AcrR family transcriptional regulator